MRMDEDGGTVRWPNVTKSLLTALESFDILVFQQWLLSERPTSIGLCRPNPDPNAYVVRHGYPPRTNMIAVSASPSLNLGLTLDHPNPCINTCNIQQKPYTTHTNN